MEMDNSWMASDWLHLIFINLLAKHVGVIQEEATNGSSLVRLDGVRQQTADKVGVKIHSQTTCTAPREHDSIGVGQTVAGNELLDTLLNDTFATKVQFVSIVHGHGLVVTAEGVAVTVCQLDTVEVAEVRVHSAVARHHAWERAHRDKISAIRDSNTAALHYTKFRWRDLPPIMLVLAQPLLDPKLPVCSHQDTFLFACVPLYDSYRHTVRHIHTTAANTRHAVAI
jgi:hypothetical protein